MLLTDSSLLFLAGAVPHYLTEIVALIVAGAVIAYISFRLRLVPIVGFLLAGVLIGPNALGTRARPGDCGRDRLKSA
jgi:CPA2 family monovalent cation:H+ antiporter-2